MCRYLNYLSAWYGDCLKVSGNLIFDVVGSYFVEGDWVIERTRSLFLTPIQSHSYITQINQ